MNDYDDNSSIANDGQEYLTPTIKRNVNNEIALDQMKRNAAIKNTFERGYKSMSDNIFIDDKYR